MCSLIKVIFLKYAPGSFGLREQVDQSGSVTNKSNYKRNVESMSDFLVFGFLY
jgi:hypothetical protein